MSALHKLRCCVRTSMSPKYPKFAFERLGTGMLLLYTHGSLLLNVCKMGVM